MYDKMNRIVVILLLHVLLFSFTIDHKIGNNNLRRMIMRIVLSHHEKMEIGNWQHVIKEVISKILDSILKKGTVHLCPVMNEACFFFSCCTQFWLKICWKLLLQNICSKNQVFIKQCYQKQYVFIKNHVRPKGNNFILWRTVELCS